MIDLHPIMDDGEAGVAGYEDGKFRYWMPYEQYVAGQFLNEVRDRTWIIPVIWGKEPIKGEERYNIAKEIFDSKYKMLNLSEDYLLNFKSK
jgi:hypothetical protein